MCRELKGKQALVQVLRKALDASMDVYGRSGDEDNLRELLDAPNIIGNYYMLLSIYDRLLGCSSKISVTSFNLNLKPL